jgi:hypothetical protein
MAVLRKVKAEIEEGVVMKEVSECLKTLFELSARARTPSVFVHTVN